MTRFVFAAFLLALVVPAEAGGWATVHRYVHQTGRCETGREVLATTYTVGVSTASGERFNVNGLTAASHDYALGTVIAVTNPVNGKTCSIRVNDRGPYGMARSVGVKLDFARGAAHCLGMADTQFVCAP